MALLRVRGMLGKLLGLLCFGLLGLLLISMFDRTSMKPLKTPRSMSGKHDLARSLLETKARSNSSATAGVDNVDIKQVPTKIHKVGGGETFQGEGRLSQGQDQSSQGQHLMRKKETVLSLKASSPTSNESNDAKSKLTKHDMTKTLRGNINDKKSALSNRTSLSVKLQHGAGARRMFHYVVSSTTTSSPQHIPTGNHSESKLPRVLCWLLTDPSDLDKRTKHVRDTWARRCDVTLYMSSAQNDSFPTIGLKVPAGRNHIAAKAKAAWKYIYQHHLEDADFFLKADPDTYIIVENLKEYLSHEDSAAARYYGHRFSMPSWGYTYMSGGSGLVLTKAALRRLVERAFNAKPNCMPDGQGEDWKTAKCLSQVGAAAVDTRDAAGRERFLVFTPVSHVRGRYPEWYVKRDPDGALKGDRCCSNYPISFHYIKPDDMYVLEYFLYRARPHGKELVRL